MQASHLKSHCTHVKLTLARRLLQNLTFSIHDQHRLPIDGRLKTLNSQALLNSSTHHSLATVYLSVQATVYPLQVAD